MLSDKRIKDLLDEYAKGCPEDYGNWENMMFNLRKTDNALCSDHLRNFAELAIEKIETTRKEGYAQGVKDTQTNEMFIYEKARKEALNDRAFGLIGKSITMKKYYGTIKTENASVSDYWVSYDEAVKAIEARGFKTINLHNGEVIRFYTEMELKEAIEATRKEAIFEIEKFLSGGSGEEDE